MEGNLQIIASNTKVYLFLFAVFLFFIKIIVNWMLYVSAFWICTLLVNALMIMCFITAEIVHLRLSNCLA